MFGKKAIAQEIASLIGAGTTVTGDVSFSGGLRVDGVVRGAVRCSEPEKGGMLVISEHGTVEGEVRASHVLLKGPMWERKHAVGLFEQQPCAFAHAVHDVAGPVQVPAIDRQLDQRLRVAAEY